MAKIEFDHFDFHIRTLHDGKEIIQLKASKAFDEDFVEEMKGAGVKPEHIKEQKPE